MYSDPIKIQRQSHGTIQIYKYHQITQNRWFRGGRYFTQQITRIVQYTSSPCFVPGATPYSLNESSSQLRFSQLEVWTGIGAGVVKLADIGPRSVSICLPIAHTRVSWRLSLGNLDIRLFNYFLPVHQRLSHGRESGKMVSPPTSDSQRQILPLSLSRNGKWKSDSNKYTCYMWGHMIGIPWYKKLCLRHT